MWFVIDPSVYTERELQVFNGIDGINSPDQSITTCKWSMSESTFGQTSIGYYDDHRRTENEVFPRWSVVCTTRQNITWWVSQYGLFPS